MKHDPFKIYVGLSLLVLSEDFFASVFLSILACSFLQGCFCFYGDFFQFKDQVIFVSCSTLGGVPSNYVSGRIGINPPFHRVKSIDETANSWGFLLSFLNY